MNSDESPVRWRRAVARVQKSRRLETDIVNNDINERVQLCAVTSGYRAVPRVIDIPRARARECDASLLFINMPINFDVAVSGFSPPSSSPRPPSHKLCTQRIVASASGIVARMYTFHNLIASWCHLRAIDHPRSRVHELKTSRHCGFDNNKVCYANFCSRVSDISNSQRVIKSFDLRSEECNNVIISMY